MNNTDLQLIEHVARELINNNGVTSTLEIKEELRRAYPGRWYQTTVSEAMQELSEKENKFQYHDNGTFHEYRLPDVPKLSLISRFLNLFKR